MTYIVLCSNCVCIGHGQANMDEGEAKQIDGDSTTLREFSRAVGGHSTIFKFDETTICKVLTPREFYFYKNFDGPIRTFIPKFKGIT